MRNGKIQNLVLKLSSKKEYTIEEMCKKIYNKFDSSIMGTLKRSLKRLEERSLIKIGDKIIFLKNQDIVSKIRPNRNKYKMISIPETNETKSWKIGDMVKMEKI